MKLGLVKSATVDRINQWKHECELMDGVKI